MESLQVTTYGGFTKVSGSITLEEMLADIRGGKHARIVARIGQLTAEGKTKEASNVKRQLPFFTVTAGYREKRLAESIGCYNDLVTIDIDGLKDEQLAPLRALIEQDEATVANFLTARQHGFKIFAYLTTSSAQTLREAFRTTEAIAYERLEAYHCQIYELTRLHYEQLLGVEVDTSGKDLSRGVFASYDPQAFFSPQRLAWVIPLAVSVLPPEPIVRKSRKQPGRDLMGGGEDVPASFTQMEFRKCLSSTRRLMRYEEGNYNNFLFTLGNKCFRKGLDEQEVKALAAAHFGNQGQWDTDTPIGNAYTYTDKTERAGRKADRKQPTDICDVMAYLDQHYEFRRNTVLDRLEMRARLPLPSATFHPVRAKDFNTVFLRLNQAGIRYPLNNLRAIIDSEYAGEYNPFLVYFTSLPPWDGVTDHIGRLADTVAADDPLFWRDSFRRWIVGLVASAIDDREVNQQVLLLHGAQGKGKSTWIRNLLPPELREYYRNGMIDPVNKDDQLLLSTRLLINMEEFEGVKPGEVAALKRIITQENVTVRKVYDTQAHLYIRRASFIGSTNNLQFLRDQGGSARRFLVTPIREIDYRRPVNYEGVYGQAMALIRDGFRYWFEGQEIDRINTRNERHRMKDPLEENLYVYYRPARPADLEVKWKPAATLLTALSIYGRTQANALTQQVLVQILERDGFTKRLNEHDITEYAVVEISPQEVNENFRRVENRREARQDEIPF